MHLYEPPRQSFFVCFFTSDMNGLAEVAENYSNDTLTCDDDAHKTVLCSHSPFF